MISGSLKPDGSVLVSEREHELVGCWCSGRRLRSPGVLAFGQIVEFD